MNTRTSLVIAVFLVMGILVGVFLWPRGNRLVEVVAEPRGEVLVVDAGESSAVAEADDLPEENVATDEVVEVDAASDATETIAVEEEMSSDGVGALRVRVVEEGTRIPLERVTVSMWLEGAVPPVRRSGATDEEGLVVFEELAPGEYGLNLRWTIMPGVDPYNVSAVVNAGEATVKELAFPGREAFLFRLIDMEENPIPGIPLKVGFYTTQPPDKDTAVYEEATTAADGTFIGLGYKDQLQWMIAAGDSILMRKAMIPARREERGLFAQVSWSNPVSFRRDTSREAVFVQDVVALQDLVTVEGVVVGARDLGPNAYYVVYAYARERSVRRMPVVNNRFSFVAPTSLQMAVSLCSLPDHAGTPPQSVSSGILKPFGGTLELFELIELPAIPGPYALEMRFPDPVVINGRVVDPSGDGVADVEVIAASAMDRESFDFLPQFVQADLESITRRSAASNAQGEFVIEVPPDLTLDFYPDLATVPKALRTHRELRRTAQELIDEPEVTLHLQYSSLVWGELVDVEGNPVAGQPVELFSFENESVPIASTVANDEGIFELNAPVASPDTTGDEVVLSQEHYIRAGQPYGAPRGYAAVAFNTADPITVVMRDLTTVLLEPPEGERLPFGFHMTTTMHIPGLERRAHGMHGGTMHMRGHNRLRGMLRGYTRVELRVENADDATPFIIDIPADAPDVMTVVWE